MSVIELTTWSYLFQRIWLYLLAAALSAAAFALRDLSTSSKVACLGTIVFAAGIVFVRLSSWLVYRLALEQAFAAEPGGGRRRTAP